MARKISKLLKPFRFRAAALALSAFAVAALMIDGPRARSAAVPAAPVTASAVSLTSPASRDLRVVASHPIELLHTVAPTVAQAAPSDAAQTRNRTVWMEVTAYCGCKKCCGPRACGITASGRSTTYNGGLFVAADTSLLPFGSQVQISGYAGGQAVEVIDRGSAIKGHHIDLFFPTHEEALAWGRRWMAVTVVQ